MQLGRIGDAEAEPDRLEPVVTRMRQPLARWHLVRSRAAVHIGRGRFADALAANEEAAALAERGHHPDAARISTSIKMVVALRTGAEIVETPEITAALDAPWAVAPLVRLASASAYLAFGRTAEAIRLYHRLPPATWQSPPFLQSVIAAHRAEIAAPSETVRPRSPPTANCCPTPICTSPAVRACSGPADRRITT